MSFNKQASVFAAPSLLLALAAFLFPLSSRADTLSTSPAGFSLASSSSEPPVPQATQNVDFTQFNPALGTLTAVDVVSSSTLVPTAEVSWSTLGACGISGMTLTPSVGIESLAAVSDSHNAGTGSFCGPSEPSETSMTPFDVAMTGSFSAYMGSGFVPVTFSYAVTTTGEQGNESASWAGDAYLVYTYTPASTVPEPSSLPLLSIGLASFIGFVRGRR